MATKPRKKHFRKEEILWTFGNQQVITTIGVLTQYPIPEELKGEKVTVENGKEAFIYRDTYQNNFLYYYDTDKVIVVSGKVSRSAINELTYTLPSVPMRVFQVTKREITS
ncbi:hypothetical protein NCCP2716_29150 [Sporosarcina sp. NCCP-2716]|nr:hypothetical protein NCCP2716_29150 [Sporosarcina sp. NCCP-2716]